MTVHIDKDYKCYAEPFEGSIPVDTDFFDGKCKQFIEGYRFVPAGESWTRPDGAVVRGEVAFPWKSYAELDQAQREHERQLLAEYAEALKIMGVTI